MQELVVYIAQGDLGVVKDGKATPLPSQRLKQYERTLRTLEEKHAWKTEGSGAKFMQQQNPYAGASEVKGRVTAITAYGGDVVYASLTGEAGGMYRKDPNNADADEGMLYSGASFEINDLYAHKGIIVASVSQVRGERHIAAFVEGQPGYALLTEGDTCDRYPFLSPGTGDLYYSSAGHARSEQNALLGMSPYVICKMNRITGEVEEFYADPALDCLKYSENEQGHRYVMVRPYGRPSHGPDIKNMALAPFRFLRAVGGFLNLFTQRYGGQNLSTGGGTPAQSKQKSQKELFIEGNLIQAERHLKDNAQKGEKYPGILPREWRLARIRDDGILETVKRGVLDYALLPSGGFVYTNGQYVIACDEMGKETVLVKDTLVTRLAVVA